MATKVKSVRAKKEPDQTAKPVKVKAAGRARKNVGSVTAEAVEAKAEPRVTPILTRLTSNLSATTQRINELLRVVDGIQAVCEDEAGGNSEKLVLSECRTTAILYLTCVLDQGLAEVMRGVQRLNVAVSHHGAQSIKEVLPCPKA